MKKTTKYLLGSIVATTLLSPLVGFAAGPYLQLSSYSGEPGSTVVVRGYQFGPSTNAFVSLAGTSIGVTMSNGFFSTMLSVPTVSQGSYAVRATSPQREQASADFYIERHAYYPHAHPSRWYILPGQSLSFSGEGYAPHATITVSGGGTTLSTTADSNGTFSTNPIMVPYSWQNSTQTYEITSSGVYGITMSLPIGAFYPNLNPTTYYSGTNQNMGASATGFASGEPVSLSINGSSVAQKNADSSGNVFFDFVTPVSGRDFTLTARGIYSNVSSSRTIGLH